MAENKKLDFIVIYPTLVSILEFVRDFTDNLENYFFAKALKGYYADRDEPLGSNVFHQLSQSILSAKTVFVVFPKGFQEDAWAKYSSQLALLLQIRSGKTLKIVPIQLGDKAVIPNEFQMFTSVRFSEQYGKIQKNPEWKKVVEACIFPPETDATTALEFYSLANEFLNSNTSKEMAQIVENELVKILQTDRHRDRRGVNRWNYPEEIFSPEFSEYLFGKKKSSGNEAATYNPTKALDILRAMRNIYIHRTKLPEDIKNYIGNFEPEEYLKFWHDRFPRFLHVLIGALRNVLDDPNAKELWKFYPQMEDKICAEQQTEESSQSSTEREMRDSVETASTSQSGPEMPEQQMSSITHHSSLSLPSADIVNISNSVQSKQAARLTNAVSDERDGINADGGSKNAEREMRDSVETASTSQSAPEMQEQQMSSITHHSSLSLPSADIVNISNSVQSKQAARLTNAVSDKRDGINADGGSKNADQHLDAFQWSSTEKPMQKLLAAKLTKDDEMVLNLLKTAYHIAKRELPKEEMKHLVGYASSLGVSFSGSDYSSNQSVSKLQHALATVILEDKLKELNNSSVYGLTIDESTDMGNLKRLIIYAQYVSDSGLKFCLLSNKQIVEGSASAVNIVQLVVDELRSKGLDITKMVGISTDGDSVMTERTGGVVKLLKDYSPSLVGVHCAAHRTALATSQAAKCVREMESYSLTIMNIFRYFQNSALLSNRLRAVQKLLRIQELKFAEVHSMRWLSLEHAVQVVYRSYPALVMTLEREAVCDAAAKGILHEVRQFKFIALTHLMLDILPFMTRLSKKFQSETVDFCSIQPYVTSVCKSLQDMLEVEGEFVEKLSKFVQVSEEKVTYQRPLAESDCQSLIDSINSNYAFEGFTESDDDEDSEEDVEECVGYCPELHNYQQQQNILTEVAPLYIEKLTGNLEDRFQDSDLVKCMDCVNPKQISCVTNVAKYGLSEIQTLAKHFEQHLPSVENVRSEYQIYKRLAKESYGESTVNDILQALMKNDDFPNMTVILKCCSVIPMTSVKCERGFCTQNRIKSKLRTSVKSKTLDDLMRIVEDGPEPCAMNYGRALNLWKNEKVRKNYKSTVYINCHGSLPLLPREDLH